MGVKQDKHLNNDIRSWPKRIWRAFQGPASVMAEAKSTVRAVQSKSEEGGDSGDDTIPTCRS
jgi:hypothetical protein